MNRKILMISPRQMDWLKELEKRCIMPDGSFNEAEWIGTLSRTWGLETFTKYEIKVNPNWKSEPFKMNARQ